MNQNLRDLVQHLSDAQIAGLSFCVFLILISIIYLLIHFIKKRLIRHRIRRIRKHKTSESCRRYHAFLKRKK